MIRKITLLLLLCIGIHGFVNAQTDDSVTIYLPFGSDTTCPGDQLMFTAVESVDTAVGSTFRWYANSVFTGVTLDTFYTTALADGDIVYCAMSFTNSSGFLDTAYSNNIIVHRSTAIMPRVLISITAGSNPDCPGHPITFTAYPILGGTAPLYQWMVDGVIVPGATDINYTSIFSDGDSLTCYMTSNSTCAFPTEFATSNNIEVIHDSLTAAVSVAALYNPICAGDTNTFTATVTDAGLGSAIYWYVNGVLVPGALGPVYTTDTLHNTDIVYCLLVAPDACVINDTTYSTSVVMTVIPNLDPFATITMTSGANPGCIDSPITFTATVTGSGTTPDFIWLINDSAVLTGPGTFTSQFLTGDLLSFRVIPTDMGCYSLDSFTSTSVLMIRDSTPVAPLVSLIDNMLVANTAGVYIWYYNGVIIPGANAQTYHPGPMGYYFAIRDTGNCQSLPSNIIYISLLDVKHMAENSKLSIYPNPTRGVISLDWGGRTVHATLTVYNVVGQAVMQQQLNGSTPMDVDMSQLPGGNYILSVKEDNGKVSTHKVMLSK